ncbi:MAG: GIY-YIG nuclease family protein [Bacteroidota bacterium]
MKSHHYYVYITTNPRRRVLYIGVTNNLDRRMQEHHDDTFGARKSFAGKFFCYNLVYYEHYTDIRVAIAREKYLKGLLREKKIELIDFFNPEWLFLNSEAALMRGNLPYWTVEMEEKRPW